ncbi:ATPase [Pseudomonas sp. WP001]|nr:ATPase [Pseudomonas sp. WP001]
MISEISLQSGRTPNGNSECFAPAPVNIFVGPNNSGKSTALREISGTCSNSPHMHPKIIKKIKFKTYTEEEARILIKEIAVTGVAADNEILEIRAGRFVNLVNPATLLHQLTNTNQDMIGYIQNYLMYCVLSLNGEARTGLINEQAATNLHEHPTTTFQRLLTDLPSRKEISRIIEEAFGLHFLLDATNLGKIRIRLSENTPPDDIERSLTEEAIKFQAAAEPIERYSDGVKAFTGIVTELIAGNPQLIFIDEPEAYLHPSLAQKLGTEISRLATKNNKQVFISTHSPYFIMGCISAGTPVNIIRLTHQKRVATGRLLRSHDIVELMRTALLRSSGVLSGLFYDTVIVTESDADRVFYQEVNDRLLRFKSDLGIPNCLFLNAQNKQTVHIITKPLRKLGIAAASIVDIDVIKDGGQVWTKHLTAANIPDISLQSLQNTRNNINKAFELTGKDMKRDGGVTLLTPDNQQAARDFLDAVKSYGIFIVPNGELESWLPELSITGEKSVWLTKILESMGDDPDSEGYVKPAQDDVWRFIGDIRNWATNPDRKGMSD